MARFKVEPKIDGDVTIGVGLGEDKILLGQLAERGAIQKVWLDITKEMVMIIIGQRGSGKSYCLGGVLEAIATKQKKTTISNKTSDRAILLLDPIGKLLVYLFAGKIYWPKESC